MIFCMCYTIHMSMELKSENTNIAFLNTKEREKADAQSDKEFEARLKENPDPTDDDKRLGVFKEMIEPQIRDAVVSLVKKGYITIDSGYHGREYQTGKQYIGFEKEMIDSSLLPLVDSVIDKKVVVASMEFDQRDFLELTPLRFLTLEEWKKIWDDVAKVFPDKGAPAPFREKFISSTGH